MRKKQIGFMLLVFFIAGVFFYGVRFLRQTNDMRNHHMMQGWMAPVSLIGVVGLIYLVLYMSDQPMRHDESLKTLKKRYTNDEIDKDTYLNMRKTLEDTK